MARLNKFASVNLNDSYGKPDQHHGGSASNNSSSSSSGKSRISSPGGMLVLTRPGRGQPPSPKPGGARLGIPSPVNLPSLKRENSGGETLAASPPLAGWTKGEALAGSPPLVGWTKGEAPADVSNFHQKGGLGRSLDVASEGLKSMGKLPDVYAPPALRAMQASGDGSTPRSLPPTTPVEKQPAIIRGEEFPTLQAAVARPPTPPQHQRQKDLQQKQREKQQELKNQQLKLQQLSQAQGQKQILGDLYQSVAGNLQLQPALPLRPLSKQEQLPQKVNTVTTGPDSSMYPSSMTNQISGQGSDYGEGSLGKSPSVGIPNQASNWTDDLREAGHNLRPQYRSPQQVTQDSFNSEIRQSGFQNGLEPSWLSLSRRDFIPSRNGDHTKLAGDLRTSPTEDMGRIGSDMRSLSFGKESYFSKDPSLFREGISAGFGREDAYADREEFSKEGSDSRFYGRTSAPVRDVMQGREGFYGQRSFGREAYNRDLREVNNRGIREPYNRDFVDDMYNKDSRDIRENYIRDTRDMYNRDAREVYNRDTRDVYTRDVKDVYNQDVTVNRQVGHGNFNNDGDSLRRGDVSHVDSPYGRGGFHTTGIAALYSPGSGHDAQYSRRYASQGIGDQFLLKEGHPGLDSKAQHGHYVELPVSYLDGLGSRRIRGPASGGNSFDSVGEVHEAQFERTHKFFEEDRQIKFEDKGREAKAAYDEWQGSNYTGQKAVFKRDLSQGPAARVDQLDTNKKLEDERSSREDLKKHLLLEEERRKEAARLKLIELEERIARRAAEEGRKEEVEIKGKADDQLLGGVTHLNAALPGQEDVEQEPLNQELEQEGKGSLLDRDIGVVWREEDLGPKLARPSSASSSSWTYRAAGEGLVAQEQDFRLGVTESELNQDRKIVRSRSPSSWRKEIGSGPTSKLFSSPYIESGGFRRPSDGGTYKLF